MAVTVKVSDSGKEQKHLVRNGQLEVEILTGLDGRVSVLRDLSTGRNFLSENVFAASGRSTLPYGLTTWVKGGDKEDGFSGVLSANLLGYERAPVKDVRVEETADSATVVTIQEGNGLRFEKQYVVPQCGKHLEYVTRVTNLDEQPRRLQIEHFFVWDQTQDRMQVSYVWPTLHGPDALRLPPYEDLDCRTIVPAEPWGAVLYHATADAVVFSFEGLWKLQRYVNGRFSEFGGFGHPIMTAPGGHVSLHIVIHVASPLNEAEVPEALEEVRGRLAAVLRWPRVTVCDNLSTEDLLGSLLPMPRSLVRTGGEFELKAGATIAANGCTSEAALFCRQARLLYGVEVQFAASGAAAIELCPQDQPGEPEAYRLDVRPEKIRLLGRPAGIQCGLQTFLDLLQRRDGKVTAPACIVEDEPDLRFRGMMMFPGGPDWDRRVERFATHVLARLKFNAFSFFVSAAGIRFDEAIAGVIVAENAIHEKRLRELAKSLRAMHIEPLPIFPTSHIRCPNQADDLRVACAMLERLADIFRPQWINLCYDEMGHFSARCNCCREKPNHVIFVESIKRLHRFLNERGTRAAIWNDMIFREPGNSLGWLDDQQWAVDHLPRDVVLNDYEYDPSTRDFARLGRWREAGFKFVTGSPWSIEVNVLYYAQSLKRYGCLGLLGTSWGDGPSETGLGHVEGVIWCGAYGWRIGRPAIAEAEVAVRRRVQAILTRQWDRSGC